ncbi:hypothetical protein FBR02_09575 [Anaerolineae bacterium CFX9]|jgi:signal recognition particle receptor subunit beta|nr:hypothetical protein [Anaerolineae bacterium CFX9]
MQHELIEAKSEMQLPKTLNVVVTGTARSGKKTFVDAIRERESFEGGFNALRNYFGRVRLTPDLTLFLFPASAKRHLALIGEILDSGFLGVVVLVDSTNPESFKDARAMLDSLRANAPAPYIIAANKQDAPGAWGIEDLRIALRVDEDMLIMPCNSRDRDSVKAVLLALFDRVLELVETGRDTEPLMGTGDTEQLTPRDTTEANPAKRTTDLLPPAPETLPETLPETEEQPPKPRIRKLSANAIKPLKK